MYRLICQKPAHFLSAQMALVSTFFQMFIVLGMYNFGTSFAFSLFNQLSALKISSFFQSSRLPVPTTKHVKTFFAAAKFT